MIHRVRTSAEFDLIGRRGRRVRNDLLWCSHLHDPTIRPARVAFAIGRAHGSAVDRNRLRRRLRAVLREREASGMLEPGWYLMGIERSMSERVLLIPGPELTDQMADLLSRLPGRDR